MQLFTMALSPREFWSLHLRDNYVKFSSTATAQTLGVKTVYESSKKGHVEIEFQNKTKKRYGLAEFKTTDPLLLELNFVTSRKKFIDRLEILAKSARDDNDESSGSLSDSFSDETPVSTARTPDFSTTSTPDCSTTHTPDCSATITPLCTSTPITLSTPSAKTSKREPKFTHNMKLIDEIKMMRSLHPDSFQASEQDFLKTGIRTWRRQCAKEFGIQEMQFGGLFREQIYLSTLPSCCYDQLLLVFDAFEHGLIESERSMTEIKPGLFAPLVGEKSEMKLHRILVSLNTGSLSIGAFRKEVQNMKKTRCEDDVEKLKSEKAHLEDRVLQLEQEVMHLRQKLEEQHQMQIQPDPYHFTEDYVEPPLQTQSENETDRAQQVQTDAEKELHQAKSRLRERRQAIDERMQIQEEVSTEVTLDQVQKGLTASALYVPENQWYPVTILGKRKNPPGARVLYEDNFRETVPLKHLRV